MEKPADRSYCASCRSEIEVPSRYAHGDHIKCGACGTQHRVHRGQALRLLLADTTPLKEIVSANQKRISALETELREARHSIGVGANGIGLGFAWMLYRIGISDAVLSRGLILQSAAIAIVSGIVLEVLNYYFLAKRKQMTRISAEIKTLKTESRQLQQKIREASRF